MAKDDTDDFADAWQRDRDFRLENQGIARLIAFLRAEGALRDSMLYVENENEWLVLYTENGAIDIKADQLTAESLFEAQKARQIDLGHDQ